MDKKEIERLIVSKFLETLGENALGDVTDHENPDFLLLSATPTLGIEITRLYREAQLGESPLKEQEVLRERVMERAKKIYDGKALPPIHVSVHFQHDFQLRKQTIDQTAEIVALLGERLIPDVGGTKTEEYEYTNRAYFPETIDFIMTFRLKGMTRSHWGAPSSGFLPKLTWMEVAQKIAIKELRLSDYWKKCSRVWLVLGSGGDKLSSIVDIADSAKQSVYTTGFERVFWFSWPKTVHELNVTSK